MIPWRLVLLLFAGLTGLGVLAASMTFERSRRFVVDGALTRGVAGLGRDNCPARDLFKPRRVVEAEYTVEGTRYTARGTLSEAQFEALRVGDPVFVKYHPDEPWRAVASAEPFEPRPWTAALPAAVPPLISPALVLLLMIWVRRRETAHYVPPERRWLAGLFRA
jgi:hypothetical protein